MRDIGPRARAQVELLQTAEQIAQRARHRPIAHAEWLLAQQQSQDIGDGALLDDQRAVHIGFTELQLGIEQHRALGRRVAKPDSDRVSRSVAERASPPARGRDGK
jgi:hypothetical protein